MIDFIYKKRYNYKIEIWKFLGVHVKLHKMQFQYIVTREQ